MDKPNPCPMCRGSKRLRHERPADIADLVWFSYTEKGECPLCMGTGDERWVTIGPITRRMEFYPIRNDKGRVLAACNWPGCTKWMDITNMIGMEKGQRVVTDFDSRCENGHRMEMHLSMPGAPKFSRGIERRKEV